MCVVLFEEKEHGTFERFQYDNCREAWAKYTELKGKTKHEAWFLLKGNMAHRTVNEMDSTNMENGRLVCAGYTASVCSAVDCAAFYARYFVEFTERPDWWPEDEPED